MQWKFQNIRNKQKLSILVVEVIYLHKPVHGRTSVRTYVCMKAASANQYSNDYTSDQMEKVVHV